MSTFEQVLDFEFQYLRTYIDFRSDSKSFQIKIFNYIVSSSSLDFICKNYVFLR